MTSPSRTQLDAAGERLRDGTATTGDWTVLTQYRLAIRETVAPVLATVRELADARRLAFSTRLKTNYSVVEKLRRTTIRLRQIDDIAGCRIIVPSRRLQDTLVQEIAEPGPAKIRDRRVRPSFGYRAVHVIFGPSPFLEVQVRTQRQDAWAELSERIADEYGQEVKYGGGPERVRKPMDALSERIARREIEESFSGDVSFLQLFSDAGPSPDDVRVAFSEIRELL